jgi:hypothetical protein
MLPCGAHRSSLPFTVVGPTYAALLGFALDDFPWRRICAAWFKAVLMAQEHPQDVLRFPPDTPATHTQQDPTEAVYVRVLVPRLA